MNRHINTRRWGLPALACLAAALVAVRPVDAAGKGDATRGPDLTARVDKLINVGLAAENVPASLRADDAEFMRRAYLDLTGVIPTAEQAATFLDGKDPNRRRKLIDDLLASDKFGRHMA